MSSLAPAREEGERPTAVSKCVHGASFAEIEVGMRHRAWLVAIATLLLRPIGVAQERQIKDYFANWDNRVRQTMSQQPDWVVPLVTNPSGVYQLLRVDFERQISSSDVTTWDIGGSKGFILVPWYKTELDLYVPPYLKYSPTGKDGFGDTEFQLKYRPFSRNNEHGDYSVNFALAGTIPTGSYSNGSQEATVTPSVSLGKGYGKFDVQSAIGGTLPVANGDTLGRPISWNTTLQWHPGSIFWPELEDNATFFHGGANDGKMQNFLLPGLMLDQFRLLHHDPTSRLALLFGGGIQIATSHFHSYNHGLVFTARLNF